MANLYVYNPENDIALGVGTPNFTAPKNAVSLRESCGALPIWLAEEGDYILVDRQPDENWARAIVEQFGITPKFITTCEGIEVEKVYPWGWSQALKAELAARGLSSKNLPSDSAIDQMRELSHRRTSIEILKQLNAAGIETPPLPYESKTREEIENFLDEHRRIVIKAPWSSSGRGVVDSALLSREMLLSRCLGVIKHQGSVVLEKHLDRIADFATLFKIENGSAQFIGFSRFTISRTGCYEANIIESQTRHREFLSKLINISDLNNTIKILTEILERLAGNAYEGYCGIDMMVYMNASGHATLAPCIELNLRTTMGVVAARIADYLNVTDETMLMRTEFAEKKKGKSRKSDSSQSEAFNNKILSVTPPGRFEINLYR